MEDPGCRMQPHRSFTGPFLNLSFATFLRILIPDFPNFPESYGQKDEIGGPDS